MKTKTILGLAVVALGATFATSAHAGVSFNFSLGIPLPLPPPLVVCQPAPVYCPPAPVVVYRPAPVPVCAPPVIIEGVRSGCGPVVYAPPVQAGYYQYRHANQWYHHHR